MELFSEIYQQCFIEGFNAYGDDKSIRDCPYPDGSDSFTAWFNGWMRAHLENVN